MEIRTRRTLRRGVRPCGDRLLRREMRLDEGLLRREVRFDGCMLRREGRFDQGLLREIVLREGRGKQVVAG